MKREGMNFKENRKGYMGGFEGRKWKGEIM